MLPLFSTTSSKESHKIIFITKEIVIYYFIIIVDMEKVMDLAHMKMLKMTFWKYSMKFQNGINMIKSECMDIRLGGFPQPI